MRISSQKHFSKKTPEEKCAAFKKMEQYMAVPANRERWNKKNRERNQNLRVETFGAYGGICRCCGEREPKFLTLDHQDGDGIAHRRSLGFSSNATGITFFKKLRKHGYPKDVRLQVLCYNCHMAKDKFGGCPHQEN